MKAIKKPYEVEAKPYDGTNAVEIVAWVRAHHESARMDGDEIRIEQDAGIQGARPGDWVVFDGGEFVVWEPGDFEANFEVKT